MEEKKLTDEEIVKAFKKGSQNHGYFTEINGKWVKYEDVFDLIHRLQDEIKEYEAVFDIYNQRKYRKMFVEEWKQEYQKELDKQGEGVIAGFPDADYVYKRYFEQKAEIERLTEENKVLKEYRKNHSVAVARLKSENAELQKQVDELKARESSIIEYVENNVRNSCPKCKERTVKDTAKEILGLILAKEFEKGDYLTDDELHELFKERYGV